jgi:hypothetical protein
MKAGLLALGEAFGDGFWEIKIAAMAAILVKFGAQDRI